MLLGRPTPPSSALAVLAGLVLDLELPPSESVPNHPNEPMVRVGGWGRSKSEKRPSSRHFAFAIRYAGRTDKRTDRRTDRRAGSGGPAMRQPASTPSRFLRGPVR